MIKLPSAHDFGDIVDYSLEQDYDDNYDSIETIRRTGMVVAIRFTRAKVFYDIVDDYNSSVYRNIPSERVTAFPNTATSDGNNFDNLNVGGASWIDVSGGYFGPPTTEGRGHG